MAAGWKKQRLVKKRTVAEVERISKEAFPTRSYYHLQRDTTYWVRPSTPELLMEIYPPYHAQDDHEGYPRKCQLSKRKPLGGRSVRVRGQARKAEFQASSFGGGSWCGAVAKCHMSPGEDFRLMHDLTLHGAFWNLE